MVPVAIGAGVVLRPNSSLAGVPGASGLASGGNGGGSREPFACGHPGEGAKHATAHNARAARDPKPRHNPAVPDLMLIDTLPLQLSMIFFHRKEACNHIACNRSRSRFVARHELSHISSLALFQLPRSEQTH